MIFSRSRDNLIYTASPTITLASGTVLTGYGTDRLSVENWAVPFKIAETTLDLRFEFDAPVLPEWVILGNSNLTVAAQWQGHTSDVWTSPDVDLIFGIPTVSVDGFFSSPHLDLTEEDAKAFWRLLITANADPVIIGELALVATRRSIADAYHYGDAEFAGEGKTVLHQTPFAVDLAYEQGTRREVLDGSVAVTTAELVEVERLIHSARFGARPFWMLPENDGADAWFVRYAGGDRLLKHPVGPGGWTVSLPVRQLSRGLPWIDPDDV